MKKSLLGIATIVLLLAAAAAGYYFTQAADGAGQASEAPDAQQQAADGTELTAANKSDSQDQTKGDAEGEESEEEGEAAVPVRVTTVSVGDDSTYITSTANLVAEDEVKVLAEAEGRVTRLLVEEGDFVKRGQLLATLLRDEAEIALNKAQLKADNARMAHERAANMDSENLISREDFDKTTMDHRIAEQELAEAKWRMEKTEIRSPFDGRLTERSVTLGQHIRPGDELFQVTDFDPLIARIYLPEKDVIGLDEGREVRIALRADEGITFKGWIRQISPVVDTATGTVKVTIAAADPPAAVRPGGFVNIGITREVHADTLILPRKAVIRELQKAHVFVAKGEVAEKRSVLLGLEEDDRLEVVSGLEAGEQVIVAGQGGLKDGATIKLLQDETEQATELRDTDERVNG